MSVLTVWRILAAGFLASLMFVLAPAPGPGHGSIFPLPEPASAARLLAPKNICRDQSANGGARAMAKARRAMACMVNYARRQKRLRAYRVRGPLNWSAGKKSADMIRCNSFSHSACGKSFNYWIYRSGYVRPRRAWSTGENIAWGNGRLGNVRSIFNAWMHSPGHRRAILDRQFTDLGIGVARGRMKGSRGARTWALHFGYRR